MGLTDLDYEGLRTLLSRASHTLDFGDADGFAGCFADGAELRSTSPEQGVGGIHRGAAALRSFVAASVAYGAGKVRQTVTCSLIEGGGSTGKSTSYLVVTRDYGPPEVAGDLTHSELVTTGVVADEYIKEAGRWLIKRREVIHDGLPDVLGRLGRPLTVGPVGA